MSARNRIGRIEVPPGITPEKHEKMTVDFLAVNLRYDIVFLVPNREKGSRTPDITMNGLKWELKSPQGKSKRAIENNIRAGLRQSRNLILDLRRVDGRIPTDKLVRRAEERFNNEKYLQRLIIITREEEHIFLE